MDPFAECKTKRDHVAKLVELVELEDDEKKMKLIEIAESLTISRIKELYVIMFDVWQAGRKSGEENVRRIEIAGMGK